MAGGMAAAAMGGGTSMGAAAAEGPAAAPAAPPTVSFTLAPGAAGAGGFVGATPRQKTVVIPRSLPELKQTASLHFDPSNRNARLRMFHKGREMHHPMAIADLKDGDEVVIKMDRPNGLQQAGDRVLTTHQADYIKHPARPRTPPAMTDDTSALSAERKKLDGQSSYTSDYPRHPSAVRPPSTSPPAPFSMHFMQNAAEPVRHSSYATHFPWHNTQPRPSAGDDTASVLTDAMRGQPFSARSSYADDYRKREAQGMPPRALGNDTASTLTDQVARQAFSGQSQYNVDFVKHSSDCRQPSARPDRGSSWGQPFAGDSEYRRQYKATLEKPSLVNLRMEGS